MTEVESDTHASFESGFRNNIIVQNNNYSSYHNYQNTPSFLAPLFTLCFLRKHHCSCIHRAPVESREEVCDPLTPSLTPYLSCTATCLDILHLPLVSWLGHVVWALWGQQIFSRVACLLHHLLFKTCMWHRKGWGQHTGLDGTQNVSTGPSLLIPLSLCSIIIIFNFYLSKKANGPNFKPKLLVWVPKVSHHDVHDWKLINLGSIDLHHGLSVALPRLQQERHQQINRGCRKTQPFLFF